MKENIRKITFAALATCILALGPVPKLTAAPENNDPAERIQSRIERNVGKFSGMVCAGSIPVTYIQSRDSRVVIEGDAKLFDSLETEVVGDQLSIRMKKGHYHNLNLSVTVYSPVMDYISSAGSGWVYDMEGHMSAGNVQYRNSGSGKIIIGNLRCRSFDCSLSGSGRLFIEKLDCESAIFSASGSGGITINKLTTTQNARMRLSGSGFGLLDDISVKGNLTLSISGSGSIKVNGEAGELKASTSGSGSIIGSLKYNRMSISTSGSGRIRL